MAKRRVRKSIPKTWEEAMNGFLIWKQAQGLSERTIKDYSSHIKFFFSRYPQAYPQEINSAALEFMAQPVKPATFNLRLVYLKAFFEWCIQEGIFGDNPLDGFKRRKAEGRVVNLDEKILTRLLSIPDRNSFSGLRDYSLLLLTLDTGIRPKEAFSLLTQLSQDESFSRSFKNAGSPEIKSLISRVCKIFCVNGFFRQSFFE